ncbi:MAG: cyclase family protein [Candidatus Lambdaproteobacteria bacterium]|nr:cyclase family protein [Candidatus Lambdaproteobacteria bacterium]
MAKFPTYDQLERRGEANLPVSWGVFGEGDQLGTLNHITDETARAAAALVRRGARFNLNLPLHVPFGEIHPQAHVRRGAPTQTLFAYERGHVLIRDDKLDGFFLQGSTQWDGLTHIGDRELGLFYNGVTPEQITQREGTRNGIEHLAAHGIVTRGVLVDLVRHFAAEGRGWDVMAQQTASADDLRACLERQKVALLPGDVLLVRQGWLSAFRAAADRDARDALLRPWTFSGVSGGEDLWRLLWDQRVAAIASDSLAVEVWPIPDGTPGLHLAIPRLGLTLGEMFDLDALADDCHADGRYTCLFVSSPLNLRGGVGSPPNALAVK